MSDLIAELEVYARRYNDTVSDVCKNAAVRIRELEDERHEQSRLIAALRNQTERQSQSNIQLREWARNLQDAQDAIEAKTVERILLLLPAGQFCDPQEIADAIRAEFAKPSEERNG